MSITAALGLLAATVSGASAASLLFDDFTSAGTTSRWQTAITLQLGAAPTQVSTDAAFIAALSGTWDVVVVQLDQNLHPTIGAALQTYIAAGNRVIFSYYQPTFDSLFGATQVSTFNSTLVTLPGNLMVDLTLSVTNPVFATGLSVNPLGLGCEGCYEFIARGFTGGTSAGLFVDDSSGIVIGNAGRTIINGFQGETLDLNDEIRLYRNELGVLVAAAVPEPSTAVLLALGAVTTFVVRYRRKNPSRD